MQIIQERSRMKENNPVAKTNRTIGKSLIKLVDFKWNGMYSVKRTVSKKSPDGNEFSKQIKKFTRTRQKDE